MGFTAEIVKRSDFNRRGSRLPVGQELTEEQIRTFRGSHSSEVVKKRWIVERSIAWMTFQPRLNRDYELLPDTRGLGDADLYLPDDPPSGPTV